RGLWPERGERGVERRAIALQRSATAFERLQPRLLVEHLVALLHQMHFGDELLACQRLIALEGVAAACQALVLRGDRRAQLLEFSFDVVTPLPQFLLREVSQGRLSFDLAREARTAFAQLRDRRGLRFGRLERRSLGREYIQRFAARNAAALIDAP